MHDIPADYLERVYAGVLGKLIGVYLGRPFEGWTYRRIMDELGPVEYYVNERLKQPLVVTDDDVAGTFTFVRALEDYGISPDLSAEDIGRAWLNYLIEGRAILWWGGNGNSTEHTAWLNLKRGIPAPASGSIATNGRTVAEQIGAQIFIDGWALVSPNRPEQAARLARQAARVSHDGETVHASMLWAAMEAAAFGCRDIDTLLDTGLSLIPASCLIAKLAADVRAWVKQNADWHVTRQLIDDKYGYHKYPGNCHVVPNHAVMLMAILYAPDDYQRSQMIVNTSGWDTDCNAGNVGCLAGIMLGLDGLDAGPDFRGPLADRMLISCADGGSAVNDAVRISSYLADLGRQLAGGEKLAKPKEGAQLHFSLPGSVQGFRPVVGDDAFPGLKIANAEHNGGRALAFGYRALGPGQKAVATTPTFTPPEIRSMRTYELMACPLIYPGQTLQARLIAPEDNRGGVSAAFVLRVYDATDRLREIEGEAVAIAPGKEITLSWRIPDMDGQPIAEAGFAIRASNRRADGRLLIDYLRWDGQPAMTLHRPSGAADADFWRMAWVNGVDFFSKNFPAAFRISQSRGEGMISHGTREWRDYAVAADITVHMGGYAGLALRVQGLRRYYGIRLTRDGKLQIVRVRDEKTDILAEQPFDFEFERAIPFAATVVGGVIRATVGGCAIEARDDSPSAYRDGAVGLVVHEGALSTDSVSVAAPWE